eukprot:363953-Chlamydomonas_euryale.AAC.3
MRPISLWNRSSNSSRIITASELQLAQRIRRVSRLVTLSCDEGNQKAGEWEGGGGQENKKE